MASSVIWQPLPGSQALALTAPAQVVLFEGSRGPGKTDCQLMRFRANVGRGYGRFWRGIIFDRRYKSLGDLISKSLRWFPQFKDGAKFLSSDAQLKWVWPSGEELLLRTMEDPSEYEGYHGHEYAFIGWNELTKWATPACFDVMMSCNRTSFAPVEHTPRDPDGKYITPDGKPLPEVPLTVFATTNPHGPGHNWVKRRFITVAQPGKIVRNTVEAFNPRSQQREAVETTQVRIFGSYRENRYLTPEYVAKLETISDTNMRRAWLLGDWDVTAGGALDDLWRSDVHILPRFPIPASWRIVRSLDWGSTHPFSVGFWAISTGEEVTVAGKKRVFPKGSLIRCHEIYGAARVNGELFGHNQGQKLGARELAAKVKDEERTLRTLGWINSTVQPGPADNQINNVNERESRSIAQIMAEQAVRWEPSDKAPGSRKMGLELMREALRAALQGEGRGLWVMDHCRAFIETVPPIPRDEDDPDDVDTSAEDHVYDEARYMVLAGKPEMAQAVNVRWTMGG